MSKDFCEFCEIIFKKREILIYDDEKVAAFHDIDKASAKEHILVCPLQHVEDISTLNESHIALLEHMQSVGRKLLEKLAPDSEYREIYIASFQGK